MPPPLPSYNITIPTNAITPRSFAPFGSIISAPLPSSTITIPSTLPVNAVHANQKTALKYANISPLRSTYTLSPSNIPAHLIMSLFSCFPRSLRSQNDQLLFDLRILERHPFTTQTFVPLPSPTSNDTRAIIIVAPTLPSPSASSALTPYFSQSKQGGLPDLSNIKAFVAESGTGVTYGVGTWHAPMVVVGEGRMDFVVTQWVNGREQDDCQEVEIPEGVVVAVDLQVSRGGQRSKL